MLKRQVVNYAQTTADQTEIKSKEISENHYSSRPNIFGGENMRNNLDDIKNKTLKLVESTTSKTLLNTFGKLRKDEITNEAMSVVLESQDYNPSHVVNTVKRVVSASLRNRPSVGRSRCMPKERPFDANKPAWTFKKSDEKIPKAGALKTRQVLEHYRQLDSNISAQNKENLEELNARIEQLQEPLRTVATMTRDGAHMQDIARKLNVHLDTAYSYQASAIAQLKRIVTR